MKVPAGADNHVGGIQGIHNGPAVHEGYRPSDAPRHPAPELLRPEQQRRPPWRRPAGQQDDMGEPSTVFPPDDRSVIFDTSYPWCTCGRVAVPGGWGSGVMIGRRHMMTASHVVPWLAGGGSDWLTFTPMQYDTSTPFGSANVTRVYWWQQVNGADGIQSNEAAFDYVVCVLSSQLGDSTGWLGARGYLSEWNGQVRWAHIGYPFDIGAGVRPVYTTNGVMDSTVNESSGGRNSFRVMHRIDVTSGQSGGPYFGWWSGEDFPSVISGSCIVSSGKWVGLRTPLHCTADGKVLLACNAVAPGGDGLLPCTDRTIVDQDPLERELQRVRTQGFAVSAPRAALPRSLRCHREADRLRVRLRREGRGRRRALG